MQSTNRTRQALHQALACAIALAIVIAVAWVQAHRFADVDRLRLPIGDLRSQAADFELLISRFSDESITPRFARVHAQQLQKLVASSLDELRSLRVDQPSLAATQSAAAFIANELHAEVQRFETEARVQWPKNSLQDRLRAIEDSLEPG